MNASTDCSSYTNVELFAGWQMSLAHGAVRRVSYATTVVSSSRLQTAQAVFQVHPTTHTHIIIHCVPKKTCDRIFDDKLKQNYPFTKIFGTLITKSIGHRLVYLVSHLTYFVHLLYLGKLSRPKYHEFSLKFLIFSMLQY